MNREEGKSSRLVKISLVVIFFAIALFVCIKIENNKKPKDEKSSYGVVRSATVSEIREPRLYMYNKVLVSETGAIYDSFSESNNVRASFSYDHKQAAITVDGKL